MQQAPAAERRCLLHSAPSAVQQSIDISCLPGAQQQSRRTPLLRSIDGRGGRTNGRSTVS